MANETKEAKKAKEIAEAQTQAQTAAQAETQTQAQTAAQAETQTPNTPEDTSMTPSENNKGLCTLPELDAKHRVASWQSAALKPLMIWEDDKLVTEKDCINTPEDTSMTPSENNKGLCTLPELDAKHRVPSWQSAALKRHMGWEDDKLVTEKDYIAALEALTNRRMGARG